MLESLKKFATGKTSSEREYEAEFNRSIKKEANEAAMVVRKNQAIKFAEERERVIYKRRTEQLHKPKVSFFSGASSPNRNFSSMFGPPQTVSKIQTKRVRVKQLIKKKKKKSPKYRYIYKNIKQSPVTQPHFRVI